LPSAAEPVDIEECRRTNDASPSPVGRPAACENSISVVRISVASPAPPPIFETPALELISHYYTWSDSKGNR